MLNFAVILDRSGSMMTRKADHEGGLRSFVVDQRKLDVDGMTFTLIQFDDVDPCEVVIDRQAIVDVDTEKLELIPRGGTPLLDAIGKGVAHLRRTFTPQDNTVVCVVTDGHENASVEWDKPKIKALITELEAGNWKFLFLGATFEAYDEAAGLGIARGSASPYNAASGKAVQAVWSGLRVNTASARGQSVGVPLSKAAYDWTEAQVMAMNESDSPADPFVTAMNPVTKSEQESK